MDARLVYEQRCRLNDDSWINAEAEHASESEHEMVMIAGGERVSETSDSVSESSSLRSEHIEEFRTHERNFAILIASTLASVPEGCDLCRLRSLLMNDWNIDTNTLTTNFGFCDLSQLLSTPFMQGYIEEKALINESLVYAVKVTPEIEHITQTIADEKLTAEQLALKRKKQRLLEMRKPENQVIFIEGKRRILGILLELRAFEEAVPFSEVQSEYCKKYEVCLNAKEQTRLFRNKSALKNIRNAFYKEVEVITCNPLFVKLKTRNVELPNELSEEDRQRAAGVGDVEVPSFNEQCSEISHERTVSQDDRPMASSTTTTKEDMSTKSATQCIREPTMKWNVDEDSDSSTEDNEAKKRKKATQTAMEEAVGSGVRIPVRASHASGVHNTEWGGDSAKYTGDEESDDSSSTELNDNGKGRKKMAAPRRSRRNLIEKDKHVPPKSSDGMLLVRDGGADTNQGLLHGVISEGNSELKEHRRAARSKSSRRQTTTERSLKKSIEKSLADWRRSQGASTPVAADAREGCYKRDTSKEMREFITVDEKAIDRRGQIGCRWSEFRDYSENERSQVRDSLELLRTRARNVSSQARPRLQEGRAYKEDTGFHAITLSSGNAFVPVVEDASAFTGQLRSAEAVDYAYHSGGISEQRFASHDMYSPESAYDSNVIRTQQSIHSVDHVSQQGFVHASNTSDVFAPKFAHQCGAERDIIGGSRPFSSRQTSGHKSPLQSYPINYFQRCGKDYPKNSDVQQSSPNATPQFSSLSAFSEFENKVNVGTQTDVDWVEKVLDQLELMGSLANDSADQRSGSTARRVGGADSDIIKLADVITMIVERRSPRPVVMDELRNIVENIYGCRVNPIEDRKYRMTWRQLVTDYCSASVRIYSIPDPEVEVTFAFAD
uniref:Uncharacterized protein n=1 Tax=Parascaris univalens TaxID=6257 RepID=A0A915BG77_PARUN